jgi:hypothetical protein
MEYDDIDSKERLTGRAYFMATGDNGQIDLGNVQLMNLDYGIKRKEHYKARRGTLIADRFDAYSATPRWEITGDEFVSATLALIFLGTAGAQSIQLAVGGAGQDNVFTGRKGKWVDVADATHPHHVGLLPATTLKTPAGKTEGFDNDYVIDRGPGKFYLPSGSTIGDGATCTVTVFAPSAVFDMITPPLSNLNRTGTMQLIEEDDDASNVPKTIHTFPVSLSTDSGGQTKVDDYKAFKMIATITDTTLWTIFKRN